MPHQSHDWSGEDSPPYELWYDQVMSNIRGRDGGYIVGLFEIGMAFRIRGRTLSQSHWTAFCPTPTVC